MGSSFIHLIRTDSNEFFLMAEYYMNDLNLMSMDSLSFKI